MNLSEKMNRTMQEKKRTILPIYRISTKYIASSLFLFFASHFVRNFSRNLLKSRHARRLTDEDSINAAGQPVVRTFYFKRDAALRNKPR